MKRSLSQMEAEGSAPVAVAEPPIMAQVPAMATLEGQADPAASENCAGPSISFTVIYGKQSSTVSRPENSKVADLKAEIEKILGLPPVNQKLLCAGKALKDDSATLKAAGVKQGCKVMLLGSAPAALEAVKPQAAGKEPENWDNPTSNEPLSKQQPHAKVLAKGLPEDALPGIQGKQVPLPDEVTMIPGLLNSQGTKVRLTFKPELQQIWIGSAVSTQKVPYSSISKIEAFPIDGQEEYSILAVHLGSGASSKYWIYYMPSQHVAAVKIRILGVASLL